MTLDVRFQFISHWAFNDRESFQAVFWQKILPSITANFAIIIMMVEFGRFIPLIWHGLTWDRPNPFCEETNIVLLKWTLFSAGPHM